MEELGLYIVMGSLISSIPLWIIGIAMVAIAEAANRRDK
jgi:hypothetical protein